MYQIDFKQPISVYFMGIGGISMSGLAEILMTEGFTVSGSDVQQSKLTEHLEALGAQIFYRQRAENITDEPDLVVYTAAIHEDNPEFQEAVRRSIPMLTRADLLGQMMRNYRNAIAVSGTHGKTTTTSMVTEILMAGNTNPTISVGGILNSIGGNIQIGSRELFVTEACEYTNSFLSFFPTMELILNIEEDHLDFFKDLADIRHSFRLFAEKLTADGVLIISSDIVDYEEICRDLPCRIITFGKPDNSTYRAANISYDTFARPSFDLLEEGHTIGRIALSVPGEHNVYNALGAIAAARLVGIPDAAIARGLLNFKGTRRRFEVKGELAGVTIVDDYAHHPQEIKVTLAAARNYPHRKVWCVFQPHTYTRTRVFLDQFAEALTGADEVILADIYAARETDTLGVSSRDIEARLKQRGASVHYFSSFDEIETFILQNCVGGDLLITMGAGDVVKVGEKLLGE